MFCICLEIFRIRFGEVIWNKYSVDVIVVWSGAVKGGVVLPYLINDNNQGGIIHYVLSLFVLQL